MLSCTFAAAAILLVFLIKNLSKNPIGEYFYSDNENRCRGRLVVGL